MKSSFVIASLCATLALSKPLEKRYLVTSWEYETVTMTVTGSAAASASGWSWGNWGSNWGAKSSATEAAVTTTEAAVTTTVPVQATSTAEATFEATSAPAAVIVTKTHSASAVKSSATVATSTASASTATATSDSSLSDYAAPILNQHNLHRANHSAPALVWDDSLASIAATIAASCVYAHDTTTGGGGYGQNIGAGAPDSDIPKMITNQMYDDEINYYPGYGSEPDMTNFEKWGHFSQIVWADTTSVGCYTQYCSGGLANTGSGVSPYFTVCNYSPPGNFGGEYAANIKAPLGDASISL